jgi:hypothetical protein
MYKNEGHGNGNKLGACGNSTVGAEDLCRRGLKKNEVILANNLTSSLF